jgi:hypothetical protein
MIVTRHLIDCDYISAIKGVDPIHVFWQNVGEGQGYATIICYGSAWTVYFGAMGGRTIQRFFLDADVDYLVTKLHAPTLKDGKKYDAYLTRIVAAIKESLKEVAE